MTYRADKRAEYARRKEFCALHNLCFKCKAPKGDNPRLCDACLQQRRDKFKQKRATRLLAGLCSCGRPLQAGKTACSHCLTKIRKSTGKARSAFRTNGKCGTCGRPPEHGSTCNKCNERATRATMRRYRRNILELKCAHCGGHLSGHTFRCEDCNRAHVTRSYLYWHRRRRLVLLAYGNRCQCCGTTNEEFLEVDHIDGGGKKHRTICGKSHFYGWIIRNNYPDTLQLLCANCNRGKSKFGTCPHRAEPTVPLNRMTKKSRRRRRKIIEAYGESCRCCGETNWAFLEFDHVNSDGRQHRQYLVQSRTTFYRWIIRNHYPDSIQLLCSNCNKAKGLYGLCPHRHRESP